MNLFQKHAAYLKDNPEGYWFKRKLYGWGWTPARWQGSVVIVVYVLVLVVLIFNINTNLPMRERMFNFILPVLFLTIALISVFYKKGEKLRWQWGESK